MNPSAPDATADTTAAAPAARPAHASTGPAVQRQLVNFAFYKLDSAFRRLGNEDKEAARSEFAQLVAERSLTRQEITELKDLIAAAEKSAQARKGGK